MKRLALIVALVLGFADTAFAEKWLCIDEAEAGVSTTEPFTSAEISSGDDKYLVIINEDTNEVEFLESGGTALTVTCENNQEIHMKPLPDYKTIQN